MTLPPPDSPLGQLMATLPRDGRVEWIGLRPRRDAAMQVVGVAVGEAGRGLAGDRYGRGTPASSSSASVNPTSVIPNSGKRGITLIQAEHLPVIAALSGKSAVDPAWLRRNVVISGLPIIALKGRRFRLGGMLLQGTDSCDPCSRMEAALGPGGYNAMRGHGGLCARILEGGRVAIGDALQPVADAG